MKNFGIDRVEAPGIRNNWRSVGLIVDECQLVKELPANLHDINATALRGLYASRFSSVDYPPGVNARSSASFRAPREIMTGGKMLVEIFYGASATSANNFVLEVALYGQRELGVASVDSTVINLTSEALAPITVANEILKHSLYTAAQVPAIDELISVRLIRRADTNASDLHVLLVVCTFIEPGVESGS